MIGETLTQMRRAFAVCRHSPDTLACWLRHTYPSWHPRPGHVALIALCGQDRTPQTARGARAANAAR